MRQLNKKGDTIIEVVLSMALLTSVLFIAWAITNRATIIQRAARERVQMVNEVKGQAELIKSQWTVNSGFFNNVGEYPPVAANQIDANPCSESTTTAGQWYLQPGSDSTAIEPVKNARKSVDEVPDKQVWVQRVDHTADGYNEFYVRACWVNNSGTTDKTENSQIILRLNT